MKKLLGSAALIMALGTAALTPAHAMDQVGEGRYWGENDISAWESDNWATDNFGEYDEDFGWTSTDESWNSWYGTASENWTAYDDIGDAGWLDV